MPALQVRDLPADVYEELKVSAESDCRSVSQQTVFILREYLAFRRKFGNRVFLGAAELVQVPQVDNRERRRIEYERLRQIPVTKHPDSVSAADLLREIREERDAHLFSLLGIGDEE